MKTNKNKMKISKEQILLLNKKISRDIEIENHMNISHNRIHKSVKSYNRQKSKKVELS